MTVALIDTNVILDVLLDRKPHADSSAAVWEAIETGVCTGFLAAHSITTIYYLIGRQRGAATAKRSISAILRVFRVAAVDGKVIEDALRLPLNDFEDSVTAAAAQLAGCNFIVSRDPKGFRGSPVRPLTPDALLPMLSS